MTAWACDPRRRFAATQFHCGDDVSRFMHCYDAAEGCEENLPHASRLSVTNAPTLPGVKRPALQYRFAAAKSFASSDFCGRMKLF